MVVADATNAAEERQITLRVAGRLYEANEKNSEIRNISLQEDSVVFQRAAHENYPTQALGASFSYSPGGGTSTSLRRRVTNIRTGLKIHTNVYEYDIPHNWAGVRDI